MSLSLSFLQSPVFRPSLPPYLSYSLLSPSPSFSLMSKRKSACHTFNFSIFASVLEGDLMIEILQNVKVEFKYMELQAG